jgi:hypothetical protein
MSPAEARQALAAQQAELVQALIGRGPPPAGFDPARLQASALALAKKRRTEAAHTWPALAQALGERFVDCFTAYAAATPYPQHGGPLADGRALVRYLAQRDELPDEGRLEALRVDLHHVPCAGGLVPRRGVVLKAAWLRRARRLVLAVRLPWLGAWWWSLPLGRRQ